MKKVSYKKGMYVIEKTTGNLFIYYESTKGAGGKNICKVVCLLGEKYHLHMDNMEPYWIQKGDIYGQGERTISGFERLIEVEGVNCKQPAPGPKTRVKCRRIYGTGKSTYNMEYMQSLEYAERRI